MPLKLDVYSADIHAFSG